MLEIESWYRLESLREAANYSQKINYKQIEVDDISSIILLVYVCKWFKVMLLIPWGFYRSLLMDLNDVLQSIYERI